MHSHKNTSPGHSREYAFNNIGEHHQPKPPLGAQNSYEKVYDKLQADTRRAKNGNHYSKAKMANK